MPSSLVQKMAFLVVLSFTLLTNVEAAEIAPKGTCARKFQRGLLNVAFSPLEISQALDQEKKREEELPPTWFTLGLGRGSYLAFLRAFGGAYEVLTFPFRCSSQPEAVSQPEFALEYLGFLKDEGET